MVRGIFLVSSSWARVLIDSGASHSFISVAFACALGLRVSSLESPLSIDTPVGGRVTLDRVCRSCEFKVARRRLVFEFVLLDMTTFDVILGMDWLSTFRATIDCLRRRVTVCTPEGDCFYFVGERDDFYAPSLLSSGVWDGVGYFLASLLAEEDEIMTNGGSESL